MMVVSFHRLLHTVYPHVDFSDNSNLADILALAEHSSKARPDSLVFEYPAPADKDGGKVEEVSQDEMLRSKAEVLRNEPEMPQSTVQKENDNIEHPSVDEHDGESSESHKDADEAPSGPSKSSSSSSLDISASRLAFTSSPSSTLLLSSSSPPNTTAIMGLHEELPALPTVSDAAAAASDESLRGASTPVLELEYLPISDAYRDTSSAVADHKLNPQIPTPDIADTALDPLDTTETASILNVSLQSPLSSASSLSLLDSSAEVPSVTRTKSCAQPSSADCDTPRSEAELALKYSSPPVCSDFGPTELQVTAKPGVQEAADEALHAPEMIGELHDATVVPEEAMETAEEVPEVADEVLEVTEQVLGNGKLASLISYVPASKTGSIIRTCILRRRCKLRLTDGHYCRRPRICTRW